MSDAENRIANELKGIRVELNNQVVALNSLIRVLSKLLPQPS